MHSYWNVLLEIYCIVTLFGACTVIEHAPLLEHRQHRRKEVTAIYIIIGTPTFSIVSQNAGIGVCANKQDYTVDSDF